MRIFVTGAAGMIGEVLVPFLLDAGHEVTALVRSPRNIAYPHPNLKWVLGDVRDAHQLMKTMAGSDFVVHLAARKADEPDSHDINVVGTKNVVEVAEKCAVRGIIHISTISTKFLNRGTYGRTKQEADEIVIGSTVPSVILKLSVVYRDFSSGIVGSMARFTKLPFVPLVGSGKATSRPIITEDVARAIACVIQKPFVGSAQYELGGPDEVTLNELVDAVAFEAHGKCARIMHIPIPVGFFLARVFSLILSRPPITASNIVGMNEVASVDPEPFFVRYDFHPRSLESGLAHIKKTERQSEGESKSILQYVSSGRKVHDFYVHMYEKAITRNGLHTNTLDARLTRNQVLLGAFDAVTKFTSPRGVFQKKMLIAAAIVESTPASSDIFLPKSRSFFSIVLTSVRIGILSACKLVVGIILFCLPGVHSKNA